MSSNPEGAAAHAAALMADLSVWTAADWRRMLDASAAGATVDGLLRPPTARTWVGEALAAYDQSLAEAGQQAASPPVDFWVSRAQAAAAIASAQQARIANLIAWKQLQTTRESRGISALPAGADDIDRQIEEGLGIA